jgi:hypothetical protein
MAFFLDVGRKIIENPNAHTIHSLLVNSVVLCWLIKVLVCLVLMLYLSEFRVKRFLLFTTKRMSERI